MRRLSSLLARFLLASTMIGALSATPRAEEPGAPEALFPELEAGRVRLEAAGWLLRGSATFIGQFHPGFRSRYEGRVSMAPGAVQANTFSADLVIGRRLWHGAEFIIDGQISRGFGFSNARGAAAFPNGEAFRLGSEGIKGYVPRAFFRQTIALGTTMEESEDDPFRFAGALPRERLTITAGKFSIWDIFDDNRYAHDPRTQFQNWAFIGAGAFDFAADARGYTNGLAVEYDDGNWGLRLGALQVAREQNSLALDPNPLRGWQALVQLDRFWRIEDRPGAVRLLYGASRTNSVNYRDLIPVNFDEAASEQLRNYRVKHNLVLNFEQALTADLGMFGRLSWNDGRSQSWMFTEQDRAVSLGLSLRGARWGRPDDTVGLATNVGWLSGSHRRFLAEGGIGFITGDGRLRYAPEVATELYYDIRVAPGVNFGLDYQLLVNPAYNADRGPISIFSVRARLAV
jgi:high affinity Mn2+ porin